MGSCHSSPCTKKKNKKTTQTHRKIAINKWTTFINRIIVHQTHDFSRSLEVKSSEVDCRNNRTNFLPDSLLSPLLGSVEWLRWLSAGPWPQRRGQWAGRFPCPRWPGSRLYTESADCPRPVCLTNRKKQNNKETLRSGVRPRGHICESEDEYNTVNLSYISRIYLWRSYVTTAFSWLLKE